MTMTDVDACVVDTNVLVYSSGEQRKATVRLMQVAFCARCSFLLVQLFLSSNLPASCMALANRNWKAP